MRVSVFGLGYVGSVSAACLANRHHEVVGVDISRAKVDIIAQGRAPIVEPQLDDLIERAVNANFLNTTTDSEEAVMQTDLSLVCVGTPGTADGNLDTSFLEKACADLGRAMAKKNNFHAVVVRSTLLPGTMREKVIPVLENATGWKAAKDFGIAVNPEFLREGSAVDDFNNPSRTVIGANDERTRAMLTELYQDLPGEIIHCPIEAAEMSKYIDNAWHATKVAFANEIGNLCKASDLDSHELMDIFCADTKLNISTRYLKPGFAFGGSCLPKDVRALTHKAGMLGIEAPLLKSLLPSNEAQIERGLAMIAAAGGRKIGILGFSFKSETDDLRESPIVKLAVGLIAEGYEIRIYDKNVKFAQLTGANRDYILSTVPQIEKLMAADVGDVLDHADTLVIGNNAPEFHDLAPRVRPEQAIVDFVRIPSLEKHPRYNGICW